jgi:hypothetical protein
VDCGFWEPIHSVMSLEALLSRSGPLLNFHHFFSVAKTFQMGDDHPDGGGSNHL